MSIHICLAAEPVVPLSSGPITDTLSLLGGAGFTAAGVLCVVVLLQVQCVYGARLWNVDQAGMLLPQDAVAPQPGNPDRHQDQSCGETTNQTARTNVEQQSVTSG